VKSRQSQPVTSRRGRPLALSRTLGLMAGFIAVCPAARTWSQPALRLTHDLPKPLVVAGRPVEVTAAFKNTSATRLEVEARLRVFQASSATRMPLGPSRAWKRLEVLAGQTILEAMPLELPPVRTATRFEVDCEDGEGNLLGTLAVFALPEFPLRQVQKLLGERLVSIIPGSSQLEELLKENQIPVAASGVDVKPTPSRVAIFLPDAAPATARPTLAKRAQSLSIQGAAVLWLKFRPEGRAHPPVVVQSSGDGAIVTATLSSLTNLRNSPAAQLELLRLIRLALQPQEWQAHLEDAEDKL